MRTAPGKAPLDVLDSPVRRHIVDLLANREETPDETPGLTAADLAAELGLHVTTARFHLDQLVQSQLVDASFVRAGVGRPRKLYRIRARRMPEPQGDETLRALTELLAGAWRPGEDAPLTPEEAGEQWALAHADQLPESERAPATTAGAWLGKVGRTVDLLQQWGYVPEVRTEDGGRTAELTLYDCPFLSLAQAHPDVVCGVHRGLLKGALRSVGEEDTEVGLQPFVAPRRCLARITTRTGFEQSGPRHV